MKTEPLRPETLRDAKRDALSFIHTRTEGPSETVTDGERDAQKRSEMSTDAHKCSKALRDA